MRRLPRLAAIQIGEFALGVAVAYACVGAVFAATQSIAAVVVAALLVAAAGLAAELRWRAKATGLAAGMVPTALLAGGMFSAFSLVLYRVG